ncbi:hypothetical protein HRbin19_01367 [bacterium HR19]|nr:hypothetical protein HRbin19_01367 [bacterium HR19]
MTDTLSQRLKDNSLSLIMVGLTIIILYPSNLNTLFYYDDNPIRFAIAKSLAEGKYDRTNLSCLISLGSSEIYFLPFFVSKIFGLKNYELIYNISSLTYFLFGTIFLILSIRNTTAYQNINFITSLFLILGLVCITRGSVHWFLSCVIFSACTLKKDKTRYLLSGLAHLISPPLILFSLLYSVLERDIRFFIFTISLAFPKILTVLHCIYPHVIEFLRYKIHTSVENKVFVPADPNLIIRFAKFEYFELSFIFVPVLLILCAKALLTDKKIFIYAGAIYYLLVITSLFLLYLYEKGIEIQKPFIFLSLLFFSPNPFRLTPLFLTYTLIYSKTTKHDKLLEKVIALFFLIRAGLSITGNSPLPHNMPQGVIETIDYLKSVQPHSVILVEGDTHIFKNGKLINPLYDSHIIPYIISKVEEKKFIGNGLPWGEVFNSPFKAGKFMGKPLEKSNIMEFIKQNGVNYVLCWTEECGKYFKDKFSDVKIIGEFKIIKISR